jgi:hypothetical protein
MAEIGKREGLSKRLAFLAPDIVEAIVQGYHPPELTGQAVITRLMICPALAGSEGCTRVLRDSLPCPY